MPVSFVNGSDDAVVGVQTLVITKPAGTVDGDDLLAFFFTNPQRAASTISGWTKVSEHLAAGDSGFLFRRRAVSEPASYTIDTGAGGTNIIGLIVTYRGASSSNPVDSQSGVTRIGGGGISFDAPSIVIVNSGVLNTPLYLLAANTGGLTVASFQAGYSKNYDGDMSPFGGRVVALSKAVGPGATGSVNVTLSGDNNGAFVYVINVGLAEQQVLVPAVPLVKHPDRGKPIDVAAPRTLKERRYYKPFVRIH